MEALKELAAEQVTGLPYGSGVKAPSKALVLVDVIKFSSGDRNGTDLPLAAASILYIDETPFSGASVPVQK